MSIRFSVERVLSERDYCTFCRPQATSTCLSSRTNNISLSFVATRISTARIRIRPDYFVFRHHYSQSVCASRTLSTSPLVLSSTRFLLDFYSLDWQNSTCYYFQTLLPLARILFHRSAFPIPPSARVMFCPP